MTVPSVSANAAAKTSSQFSWMQIMLPLIFWLGLAVLTYLFVVEVASERRVLDYGLAAEARVLNLEDKSYRDAKGRTRHNRLAHIAWTDANGAPREFKDLSIGAVAYNSLLAIKGNPSATTAIKYDLSGTDPVPFLMADLEHRETNWVVVKYFFWGWSVATILVTVWFWRHWKKHKGVAA